jgi:hypothetical protein
MVLDVVHVYHGFWSFETPKEISLLTKTIDTILSNAKSRDESGRCFLVSPENPPINFFEQFAIAAYHGRTVWPAFNVEFADRLIDLSLHTKDQRYHMIAHAILEQLETYTVAESGYPEVLNPEGKPYATWIYHSARADSWFPRFMSVRARLM